MAEHEPERESLLERDEPGPATGSGRENAGGGVTKAADASGFVRWEEEVLPAGQNLAVANKVIVKKSNVRPGAPRTIIPKIPTHVDRRSMEVTPLIEDDTIVGMKVTCSCGNSHEVKFEFDV
ncbi:MAG: hypothetical protein IID13_09155 [Candidatus Marinimicrobia bacterium]|nr:hypothetical protein [Candidatus Neomarinimicrobiota bacterium]